VEIYPAECEIFAALRWTALERVRVVILGQDPYHDTGQAHGLSFSVPSGQRIPPSLRNIYRELAADLGCSEPRTGCLAGWAEQGVLLLNSVLTVRAHEANSHRGLGWERVTGAILEAVKSGSGSGRVFMAWGGAAERLLGEIPARHLVIRSPHPSPLSAYRGFFGSRPFSRANAFLVSGGGVPIDWTRVD
jgi:uracil-DNA glycosylase